MEQKELNKILKQHKRWLQSRSDKCANLHGADLRGADLSRERLLWADLTRANLCNADFYETNLYGADLCEANLAGADLRWANLAGANLAGANLSLAKLHEANLTRADLHDADLRWTNFAGVIGLSVLSVQVNASSENRKITYIPSLDVVTAGGFQGTFKEFEKRVEEEHEDDPFLLSRYRRVIAFLKQEAEEDRAREKEMTTADDAEEPEDNTKGEADE